jgi:hypothetical protein
VAASKSPIKQLRDFTVKQAGVVEDIACPGTAVESARFKANKKSFLFLSASRYMVRLKQLLAEAQASAAKDPDHYAAGAGGWVTVKFDGLSPVPVEMLQRWIAESHSLTSSSAPASKKKTVKKRA